MSEGADKYVEHVFLQSELYFPCPAEFNDPFDCAPVASAESTWEEFAKYVADLFKRMRPEWSRSERRQRLRMLAKDQVDWSARFNDILTEVTHSVGVYCLSSKCDDVLMWSHYADSHRGICIRFKASATTPFFGAAQRVKYQADRPVVNVVKDSHSDRLEKALLTKADYWTYESEWRIIAPEKPSQVIRFPGELLDGVILGAKVDAAARERVLGWVAKHKTPVEVLEATLDERQFRMVITPVK